MGMIPDYQPPFGLSVVIMAILNRSSRSSVEQVEAAYAQAYAMPYAILLPSCRTGISWALRVCFFPNMRVVCPVYTCPTVWESVVRAGCELDVLDTCENSFLMDEMAIARAQTRNHAIVLSEIYGYTYDISKIRHCSHVDPVIRIVDMAMTVPTKQHFARLSRNDFAVLSFGSGKCMYAGWGGMGFTHDELLAKEIRKIRDSSLRRRNLWLFCERGMKLVIFNLIRQHGVYGFFKKSITIKRSARMRLASSVRRSWLSSIAEQSVSKEWYLPTTYMDRNLMLYNVNHSEQYWEHRKDLECRYRENLERVSEIVNPSTSPYALSHYTIRVRSSIRSSLKERLESAGIHTGTLFFFPRNFAEHDYPNASKTASEVLNLPLDVRLGLDSIDKISELVVSAIKHLSGQD